MNLQHQIKILIRAATLYDLDDIIALRLGIIHAYPSAFGGNPFEEANMERDEWQEWLLRRIEPQRTALFLAFQDKSLVGMIKIQARDTTLDIKHVADISDLGVLPEYTRRGIAVQLVNATLEFAAEQKIVRVQLEVWADNMPARELYKKMGFKEEGYFEKVSRNEDDEYRDSVVMAKIF